MTQPLTKMQPAPTVMVVDDDEQMREALREVLEDGGFDVIACANGRDALACLADQPPPAVILFDLSMPVMDGWEFARRLQSNPLSAGIPRIALTARASHWGYPTERVLKKPVDVRQLLDAVRALVTPETPSR